jgi:hypothetical protein
MTPARCPGCGGVSRPGRHAFRGWATSQGGALGAAGVGVPALVAACGDDDDGIADAGSAGDAATTSEAQAAEEAERTIGDVVDCALISDEPSA